MMLHGMVFKKETEGDITSVKDAKIAVFSCPFDCMVTETKVGKCLLNWIRCTFCIYGLTVFLLYVVQEMCFKSGSPLLLGFLPSIFLSDSSQGTVLIKNAEELMNFSKGEEDLMEAQVKSIADSGANVVVTGGKIADMALHYANKYKLMVVR